MTDSYSQTLRPFRIARIVCEVMLVAGLVLFTAVPKGADLGLFLVLVAVEGFFFGRTVKYAAELTIRDSDQAR